MLANFLGFVEARKTQDSEINDLMEKSISQRSAKKYDPWES
jgi:hypothetical protein